MSNKCGGGSLAIKLLAKRCICMIYRREQLNWLKILFLQSQVLVLCRSEVAEVSWVNSQQNPADSLYLVKVI